MKKLAIGIDIGGTNTNFAFVEASGKIYFPDKILTYKYENEKIYFENLYKKINENLKKINFDFEIIALSFGVPFVSFYNGEVSFSANLKWKAKVNIKNIFKKYFPHLPIYVINDAKASALGEMFYGGAKNMKDFTSITIGTGLGSGIVSNGKLIHGKGGFAGEFGHIIVDNKNRICNCGRKDCLETYVSNAGIKKTALELMQKNNEISILREIPFEKLNAEIIAKSALEGDKIAIKTFEITGKYLGKNLANLVAILHPEEIFLSGGISKSGDLILKPTKKHLEKNLLNIFKNSLKLSFSRLKNNEAAILGAVALVFFNKKIINN